MIPVSYTHLDVYKRQTEDYLALFYPFDTLDVVKKGVESSWNVSGANMMIDLAMSFMDEPMAKNMSFQREYDEPYDWVTQQFKDWAFTLTTSILYYNDYDLIDEDTRKDVYKRQDKACHLIRSQAPRF